MAKAMWKGCISLGKLQLAVKLYSAIEDRTVRFHMLHKRDLAPVEQHIVRKDTGKEVPREDIRKAFQIGKDSAVMLEPEDLESLIPPASRDIQISRFVSPQVVDYQWYDRSYYLGSDDEVERYFALAQILEKKKLTGIVRWVMRNKQYVGALNSVDGYLVITTMRRADQILKISGIELSASAKPHANELKLADQLISSISGDFDPAQWNNEYRQRLLKVISAKSRGLKLSPARPAKVPEKRGLAESLKASIAAEREKKVA